MEHACMCWKCSICLCNLILRRNSMRNVRCIACVLLIRLPIRIGNSGFGQETRLCFHVSNPIHLDAWSVCRISPEMQTRFSKGAARHAIRPAVLARAASAKPRRFAARKKPRVPSAREQPARRNVSVARRRGADGMEGDGCMGPPRPRTRGVHYSSASPAAERAVAGAVTQRARARR